VNIVEIIPCTCEQIETLITAPDTFLTIHGFRVLEGYLPFAGALEHSLNSLRSGQIWHPWLPYLIVCQPEQALVGFGGFKSAPTPDRTVEIGYSVAPSYQNRGIATAAARQLIDLAFATGKVDCVLAHTLAELNASTRVLQKCGLTQVAEILDPEDGKLWRWEIKRR
jgi:RimJ/RimL family protein N-acetyltransferase